MWFALDKGYQGWIEKRQRGLLFFYYQSYSII